MYLIDSILVSMAGYIHIYAVASVTLPCCCIPFQVTLVTFTPYRYSHIGNSCPGTAAAYLHCKCAFSATDILKFHDARHRLVHFKGSASRKMGLSVLVYDIHMGIVCSRTPVICYDHIGAPYTFSLILCLIPAKVILAPFCTPYSNVDPLHASCITYISCFKVKLCLVSVSCCCQYCCRLFHFQTSSGYYCYSIIVRYIDMSIINSILVSMISNIYIYAITTITLFLCCIPFQIALVCFAPYCYLNIGNSCFGTASYQFYRKGAFSCSDIFKFYIARCRSGNGKRCSFHKLAGGISIRSISMHIINSHRTPMPGNRYYCCKNTISGIFGSIPHQIILSIYIAPYSKLHAANAYCISGNNGYSFFICRHICS